MIAILLVGVCVTIYWIFKYDDWNSNPVIHSNLPTERGTDDSGSKELGIREE
jgi:hypothetical protein